MLCHTFPEPGFPGSLRSTIVVGLFEEYIACPDVGKVFPHANNRASACHRGVMPPKAAGVGW